MRRGWIWRGGRAWAVPAALLLAAACVVGVWTRTAYAGPAMLRLLDAADRRCPESITVEFQHPRVADVVAAVDRWAWLRLRESLDGRDRCRPPAMLNSRVTRRTNSIGMVRRAKMLP